MAELKNPLREWRGSNSPGWAATWLGLTREEYLALETNPEKSNLKSDRIIQISQDTNIPLEVLVDYLTETTKEVA